MISSLQQFMLCVGCAASVWIQGAQTSDKQATKSHVERFGTQQARAGRVEAETSAKLASNPKDSEALNLRALARLRFGKYREAYDDLSHAVTLRPDNSEYQANLGYVLLKLGRIDDAVAAERTALRLDEKNFSARFQLGRILIRLGKPEQLKEAVIHLRRALELQPQTYDVRFELIEAYRALGDRAQATNQLDFLRDARPSEPKVFYFRGLMAADRSDIEEAINEFKEALRRDPNLFSAWQDLGLAYVKLKRWQDAIDSFSELVQRQPDSIDARYLRALSLFNAGRSAEAEAEVRRVLRLNAGAGEADTLLGVILAARGDANSEASEILTQAVALNPRSFDAHFNLGRVLYAMRDFEGAVRELREAVALNQKQSEARFFLGTALEASGDNDAAMNEYQQLVKSDSASAIGQVGLGALLIKQGKAEEAVEVLKRAATLAPDSFEANFALGRALATTGHLPEAVDSLRKSTTLAPYRSDAHYQLGLALRKLGRADDAAKEFAIVEKLNSEVRTGQRPKQ